MSIALSAAVAGMGEDMVATGRLKRLSRRKWRHAKGYYLVYPEESAQMQSLQVLRAWLQDMAKDSA